jgi:hypothetical protein
MSDLSLQRVGPTFGGSGTASPFRADVTGAQVVTDAHPRFAEAALRRQLFSAYLKQGTTTVAAGNIEAAAAAASTQFAVWNPASSLVNLVLYKLKIQQFSGTPTAGGLSLSTFNAAAVASTLATAGAVRNNFINGAVGQGLCLASAAGAALTGGLALTTLMGLSLSSSATALASPAGIVFTELFDGEVVVPPGWGVVPTWAGAGTTYLVGYTLSWEEEPAYT